MYCLGFFPVALVVLTHVSIAAAGVGSARGACIADECSHSVSVLSVLQVKTIREEGISQISRGYPHPPERRREPTETQHYTVCLTTTPWRAAFIGSIVDSLLEQTPTGPSRVVLAVPNAIDRAGIITHLHEEDLSWVNARASKYQHRLVVHRMDHDFGPATKLMGCLEVIPEDDNTCLVVTDDDMARPRNWAELLLRKHTCTAEDRRVLGGFMDPGFRQMVHGARGWAVHRSLISFQKLHSFWEQNKDACMFVDDEMFTGFLRSQCLVIDILYRNDSARDVPELNDLISDDTIHNDPYSHRLSGNLATGGPAMVERCLARLEKGLSTCT